ARRMWVRSAAALAVGALILGLFIYNSDLEAIQEYMGTLGWLSPLVLLPYLIVNIFDTLGWRCTLPPAVAARVPFVSLYLTRMAGQAVNSLTVAVGGEPVKAHLLRRFGVSGSDGLASVAIAKTALTASPIAPARPSFISSAGCSASSRCGRSWRSSGRRSRGATRSASRRSRSRSAPPRS